MVIRHPENPATEKLFGKESVERRGWNGGWPSMGCSLISQPDFTPILSPGFRMGYAFL